MSSYCLNDFLRPIVAATFSPKANGAGHHLVFRNGEFEPYRPRQFGWLRGDLSGHHVFVRDLRGPKQVKNWLFRWSEGTSAIELEFDANFEIYARGLEESRALAKALLSGPDSAGDTLHALIARELHRRLGRLLEECERSGDSLHDCFRPAADGLSQRRELDEDVGKAVADELNVPFRIGFQMRDPAPRQIDLRCSHTFRLRDRAAVCEVVTTALLQLDNFQAHKRSGLHDEAAIRAAVERQVAEAVKELLFDKRYYSVARAFAGEDNAIGIDMERRLHGFAQSIGYRIRPVNALLDIPATALFRGLSVEVPAGEAYQLHTSGFAEVSLSLRVRAGDDDEAIARLIGSDVTDVAEPIEALVRRCCRETLARFTYSKVSVRFDEEVRPELENNILRELAGYGLQANITRLRSEPTEDAMRFMELRRMPAIDFVVKVPPQADMGDADEVEVHGVIDILGAAEDDYAWLRFQSGNFGYRRDSARSLDDMRAQAARRGVTDIDRKDRRALAVAIEVAEIKHRVVATLRNEMAMWSSLAYVWARAENAADIEQRANAAVARAIADEFGLRVHLRGFGRGDTLSANTARAAREAKLRAEREAIEQLAQKRKTHLLQKSEMLHNQELEALQRLDRLNGDILANPLDLDHETLRLRAEKLAAEARDEVQQWEMQLSRPAASPSSSVPRWQPPPLPERGDSRARLDGEPAPTAPLPGPADDRSAPPAPER
ncbi:hypothetical protein [Tahibacter caeni]|uniref:hypothetical protein n=1 Tax=Tahibacter caeni TaxID=1453545 RepID=UPI0021477FEF|nr:hypothetical protein [Tahibacter caeni]